MVEAIEERTRQAEQQLEFRDEAEQRLLAIAKSGRTIPWKDMRGHLLKRVRGTAAPPPRARRLARS